MMKHKSGKIIALCDLNCFVSTQDENSFSTNRIYSLIPYLLVAVPRCLNLEIFSNCYMMYVRIKVFRGVCIWSVVFRVVILCCSLVYGQQCCGKTC
jgi:hypothetical protein